MTLEFAENSLPVPDAREVAGRGGEHSFEESAVGSEALTVDFDRQVRVDEIRQKKIVDKMLWLPGSSAGWHRIELPIELTGARTAEECEVQEMCETFRIGIRVGRG